MNRSAVSRTLSILLLVVAVALPTYARGKKDAASTSPGSYKEWKGEIDELTIEQTFRLADYDTVLVTSLNTSSTPLPESSDNSYKAVKDVLAGATVTFADALKKELQGRISVEQGAARKAPKVLIVRGTVDEIDPGSRAARYWGGFGAGAARTKISGEIVDAKSGAFLARFTQERRSGVGAAGGAYDTLLNRNIKKIAEDVALILNAF